MNWHIVALDRSTLVERGFDFPFAHTLHEYTHTAPQEVLARIANADIIISNKVVITAQHIKDNPSLKLIAVTATGYNNVDIQAAKDAGVTVCNIRAYGNESVAQHAFMLMITLMRNLPAYQADLDAGKWQTSPFFCYFGASMRDLNGKTLAIFGRGNIGNTLAGYAKAFGMTVIFGEHKNASTVRAGYTAFDEAICQSDVISLHCPLSDNTANMIGEAEFAKMKTDAILINCGRGGLVDEAALLHALMTGQIGGAGFDVLNEEPPSPNNPLATAKLPNFILTPHMAWGSIEAQNNLFDILVDNITSFVNGTPKNVVV